MALLVFYLIALLLEPVTASSPTQNISASPGVLHPKWSFRLDDPAITARASSIGATNGSAVFIVGGEQSNETATLSNFIYMTDTSYSESFPLGLQYRAARSAFAQAEYPTTSVDASVSNEGGYIVAVGGLDNAGKDNTASNKFFFNNASWGALPPNAATGIPGALQGYVEMTK